MTHEPVPQPWRLLVLTAADGTAAPAHVWLPPLPSPVPAPASAVAAVPAARSGDQSAPVAARVLGVAQPTS